MVHIKFYGWIRSAVGCSSIETTEKTVNAIFDDLLQQYNQLDKKMLLNAILFINHTPYSSKSRLQIALKEGDELAILSPVCGG